MQQAFSDTALIIELSNYSAKKFF